MIAPSPRLGRPGPRLFTLVVVALIWLPRVAQTAELYADGRVGQQFEYDTNIDLDSEQGDSGAGSRSRAGIVLGVRTPATDLALDGEFRLVRFPNQTQLNSEIASLIGRGRWNWRRANLGLTAGVVRDTTLEVEEVQTTRSIGANEERLTFNVSSSYDYQVSRVQTAGLSFNYSKRIFPTLSTREQEELGQEAYSFYRLGGTWRRALTSALALRGSLGSSYFDSNQEESISGQARVGIDYALTPALSVDGDIGPAIAHTDDKQSFGGSETSTSAVWDIGLSYLPSADAGLRARLSQNLEPQSTGGAIVLRTSLQLGFDYQLTRHTSFDLPLDVSRDDAVAGEGSNGHFVRVQPGLSFRITPQARIRSSYRFRLNDEDGSATSHAILVDFSYDLPSFATSR